MSGNMFPQASPIKIRDVMDVEKRLAEILASEGIRLITGIGSSHYKATANDIDVFVNANRFDNEQLARQYIRKLLEHQLIECKQSGRIVHALMPNGSEWVQVDIFVLEDANRVAQFHQHGNAYNDPSFSSSDLFILYASIAKYKGLKFDPFAGKLIDREDLSVVAIDTAGVAKALLGPDARPMDINPHKSEMVADARANPRMKVKI